MRRLAVLLAALVALVPTAPAKAAGAPPIVTYRPPVDAPVLDAFRPPPENWNAVNRGIEYATRPGSPVGAAADGEVVFAGPIAGEHHVVVLGVPTRSGNRCSATLADRPQNRVPERGMSRSGNGCPRGRRTSSAPVADQAHCPFE